MDTLTLNSLDTFIDTLLSEAYPNTPLVSSLKASMKIELKNRLVAFINTDLLNAIPQEHREELNTLVEKDEPREKINSFIASHVPDQESLVATSLINFRNMYLGK